MPGKVLPMRSYSHAWTASLLISTCGCTSPGVSIRAHTHTQFADVSWQEALEAAEQTMREFFRIEEIDHESGVIRAVPSIETPASRRTIIGPIISSPWRVRRVVELRIELEDGGVWAICRVLVQRHDAVATRVHLQQTSIHDVPNQTPLEESQGFGESTGRGWITTGRDNRLERTVLAALAERLVNQ